MILVRGHFDPGAVLTSTRYNKKGPVDSVGLSMGSLLGPGSRVSLSVESGLETPGIKLRVPVHSRSKSDSNQKLFLLVACLS